MQSQPPGGNRVWRENQVWEEPTEEEIAYMAQREALEEEERAEVDAYVEAKDFPEYQEEWEKYMQRRMGTLHHEADVRHDAA